MLDTVEGRPLGDIRVVAIEQAVAGPLCTRNLADLGAEVIKIERPDGGDFARGYDAVARGRSAYFVWLNYGKRSVILDLHTESGRARLAGLLDGSQVLVHNLGPGALERLGFDEPTLAQRWPSLVRCAISGYGADGPFADRKAFDLLLQGESGLMMTTGTDAEPARIGISIADIAAGMYATSAVLAALRQRDRTTEGSSIEVSMLDCLADWMSVPGLYERYGPGAPARTGMRHATIVPYGPFACRDGAVNLAVQNRPQWERLCRVVLRRPDLIDDARYATNIARVQNRTTVESTIGDVIADLQVTELRRRLREADVPFGDVNDVAGLLAHEQLSARDRWFDVATAGGPVRLARSPLRPSTIAMRPPSVPELGEDDEVFG